MSSYRNKKSADTYTTNEPDNRVDESAVEIALNETGFGMFSFKITALSYLIYMNMSLSVIITGFIIPAAACDLKMDIFHKSLLSTAFLVGSGISTIISGVFSNIKGRKLTVLLGLFLQGNSDLLQSIVSNYWAMIGLKVISGVGTSAQNFIFAYFSECFPSKNRNFILSFMELFWISGHAFAAGVGWGIIPLEFKIQKEYFSFRSWNLYILICSLLPIILGTWMIFFPETPKYLAETASREKLLQVLVDMYQQNCKKPAKNYIEKLINTGNASLIDLVRGNNELSDLKEKSVSRKIFNQLKQMMYVLKPPFLRNTILASMMSFSITASFYSLFVWLPEIFQRFANFEAGRTDQTSNFCAISRDSVSSIQNIKNLTDSFGCDKPVDNKVYINNLILCASCIPTVIIISLFVKRCGLKIVLSSSCSVSLAVIVGLYFVNSFLQNLILLCFYLALISACMTLQFAYCVSIFPTNLRSSGVIVTIIFCRVGALFGNFIFSSLKDYCLYFILLVTMLLLIAAISTILIRERQIK